MRGLIRSRTNSPPSIIKKIKISFANKTISLTDPGGAAAYGSVPLFDLPKGNIVIFGALMYLKLTSVAAAVSATFDGDFSVGRLASTDATFSGNEVEIIQLTTFPAPAASKATSNMRAITAQSNSGKTIPNTDGTLKAQLNVLLDDSSISASADLTASGDFYLCYGVF